MGGRTHAYTKRHGGHLVSHGLATRLLHTLYVQGRAVEACYLICAAPFAIDTHVIVGVYPTPPGLSYVLQTQRPSAVLEWGLAPDSGGKERRVKGRK